MNILQFKIRELEDLPPDRREAILRRCFESGEFFRRRRKIAWVCFLTALTLAIGLINVFTWTGIAGRNNLLAGLLPIGTVVLFIALMVIARIWFTSRLLSKLVGREIHDQDA